MKESEIKNRGKDEKSLSSPSSSSSTSTIIKKNEVKRKVKDEEEKPVTHLKVILGLLIFLWLAIYAYKPQLFHGHKTKGKSNVNPYYNDVVAPITVLNGLKSLSKYEERVNQCNNKTILVGYNTNLDLIVDAIDLLSRLSLAKTRDTIKSHDVISSLSQLESTFSYYFESGSAAERFIDDEQVFQEILKVSNQLEKKSYFTGGNAGIMANVLAEDGCNVYLSGVVGEILKGLLHPNIKIIPNSIEKKVDDEVHLIMEYNQNSQWHGVRPPRSNRFIVSRDLSNSKLVTLESLHNSIETLDPRPDLLLLSGLHLLTSESQLSRTLTMVDQISKVPFSPEPSKFLDNRFNIPIHLELASVSDSSYMKLLSEQVIPRVDSLGLNEQELGFLYLSSGGSKYTLDDFKSPDVRVAVEAIKHIFNEIIFNRYYPNYDPLVPLEKRVTSRIHFHYLTYHIIAIKEDFIRQWGSSQSSIAATAASSLEATKNACDFTQISIKLNNEFEVDFDYTPGATKTIKLNLESPVSSWRDRGIEFYIAPVLVCDQPSKTVGLGDSISTISYLYQTIKSQK